MKDTLDRRIRFAPPQPAGRRIELAERDLQVFEAIHRHGPLPTHYLYEFVRPLSRNYTAFQQRLTKLFNGAEGSPSYLVKPPQQHASFYARYQQLIYDLSPKARQILSERGRLMTVPHRVDPFLHRLMNACVGASLDLALRAAGRRYLAEHDIFAHGGSGEMAMPLAGGRVLVPDRLFGIDYGGKYRFFAAEIDRNTESLQRKNLDQSSFAQKIRGYTEIIRDRLYKRHWDVPNLIVLFVTTNATHMKKMLSLVEGNPYADRFLFKTRAEFGANWSVPPVMLDLYAEPWTRAGENFSITQ